LDVALHDKLINNFNDTKKEELISHSNSCLNKQKRLSHFKSVTSRLALTGIFNSIQASQSKTYSTIAVSLEEPELINNYIEPFFVGLLEGDGTITTDLNGKSIRVRIVISLNNTPENLFMLKKIKEKLGGRVIIERNNTYVTWIASNNKDLVKIFAVLAKFPLLTARKQSQLEFATNCLLNKDLDNFLVNRKMKYKNKNLLLKNLAKIDNLPSYFAPWLSGFIEAEGNFSLVFKDKCQLRKSSFSIGQNDELHILNWIKLYFKSNNIIITDKPKKDGNFKYYRLNLYNAESRKGIFEHFEKYPLLGYKNISFNDWKKFHENKDAQKFEEKIKIKTK